MDALPSSDPSGTILEKGNNRAEENQAFESTSSGELPSDADGDKNHMADEKTVSDEGNTSIPGPSSKGMPLDCLCAEVG
jgi:hypothetical protein